MKFNCLILILSLISIPARCEEVIREYRNEPLSALQGYLALVEAGEHEQFLIECSTKAQLKRFEADNGKERARFLTAMKGEDGKFCAKWLNAAIRVKPVIKKLDYNGKIRAVYEGTDKEIGKFNLYLEFEDGLWKIGDL